MYIALSGGRNGGAGEERVRGLVGQHTLNKANFFSLKVEEAILEHWWLSYMELLHRLQLFTQGNQVGFAISVWCFSSNNFSLKQIACLSGRFICP